MKDTHITHYEFYGDELYARYSDRNLEFVRIVNIKRIREITERLNRKLNRGK